MTQKRKPWRPCDCGCHDTSDGYADAGDSEDNPDGYCSNCADRIGGDTNTEYFPPPTPNRKQA